MVIDLFSLTVPKTNRVSNAWH